MRKVKYVKRRQRGAAVLLASLILLLGAAIYIGTQLATTSTRDYKGRCAASPARPQSPPTRNRSIQA